MYYLYFKGIVKCDYNVFPSSIAKTSFCVLFQALESLSLADSKLKGETAYIINALGSNETLLEIDIR